MKLLVFVAFGAIWLIGHIVKARTDKAEAERRKERQAAQPQPQTDSARRRQLAARQARLEQQMRQRQAQAQAARTAQHKLRPSPAYNRPPATKRQPAFRPPPLEPEPSLLEESHIEMPKLKLLEPTKCATAFPAEESETEFELPQLIGGPGGPDDLKAAIMYHEILGLPLALREEWLNLSKY